MLANNPMRKERNTPFNQAPPCIDQMYLMECPARVGTIEIKEEHRVWRGEFNKHIMSNWLRKGGEREKKIDLCEIEAH